MPNNDKRMKKVLRRNLKSIEKAGIKKPEAEPDKLERKEAEEKTTKKSLSLTRRIFKIIGNVIFALVLLSVAVMAFFMIRSRVKGTPPMIAGHYLFIVLSGSMEPEFDTGSIVFVKPTDPETIKPGDIVTFSGFAGSKQLTTHRVMEVTDDEDYGLLFITKGDANEHNDPDPVPAANIKGTVSGHVPLLGYLMSFVQTRQGLILIILIPACLLIGIEVYSFLTKRDGKKKQKADAEKETEANEETETAKTENAEPDITKAENEVTETENRQPEISEEESKPEESEQD